MQNPLTMDRPAPSCMLVNILAKQPAVLIKAVIRLSWPVFFACIITLNTKPITAEDQGDNAGVVVVVTRIEQLDKDV